MIGYKKVFDFPDLLIMEEVVSNQFQDGEFRSAMIGDIVRSLDDLSALELFIFNDIFQSWILSDSVHYAGKKLDHFLSLYYECRVKEDNRKANG